jgi:hypothetical protein
MKIKETLTLATQAGEHAATVCYDALTPETARSLLASGRDIVPDFAGEAAREVVLSALPGLSHRDVRGTRIAEAATRAWSTAFRAAWPASDVTALAEAS